MPAKTGQEYIDRLKKANNNVYIHGERVDFYAANFCRRDY